MAKFDNFIQSKKSIIRERLNRRFENIELGTVVEKKIVNHLSEAAKEKKEKELTLFSSFHSAISEITNITLDPIVETKEIIVEDTFADIKNDRN